MSLLSFAFANTSFWMQPTVMNAARNWIIATGSDNRIFREVVCKLEGKVYGTTLSCPQQFQCCRSSLCTDHWDEIEPKKTSTATWWRPWWARNTPYMLPQVPAVIRLLTTTMNSLFITALTWMTMILPLGFKSIQKMKPWASTSLRFLVPEESFQPFAQTEPRQHFEFDIAYSNQSLRDWYRRKAAGHFLSRWSANWIKLRVSDGKPGRVRLTPPIAEPPTSPSTWMEWKLFFTFLVAITYTVVSYGWAFILI